MDKTPDYVPYLLAGQVTAARKAGVDPYLVNRESYVLNLSVLALIGMVAKALADKNIVTDADWQTRLNAAYDGFWSAAMLAQVEPNRPVDPGATPQTKGTP